MPLCNYQFFQSMSTSNGPFDQVIASPAYQYIESTEAFDGLVPVSSAQAFPGATILDMPGSNHEQMKNDSKLRDKLIQIYNGNFPINTWWATPVR